MKTQRLIMGTALTGALLVSASVAKANAYMELISGSSKVIIDAATFGGSQTGYTQSGSFGVTSGPNIFIAKGLSLLDAEYEGPVGSWYVSVASGNGEGLGSIEVQLGNALNIQPTAGLELIFSSGTYAISGNYNYSSDSSQDTQNANAAAYYSSSLYNGTGSYGTMIASNSLPDTGPGGNDGTSSFHKLVNIPTGSFYVTDVIQFAPPVTSLHTLTGQQEVNIGETLNTLVPDGGSTATMVGAALLGLVGIRSKFSGKRS